MLYWRFHFDNEIPINCLFTQWKRRYILDFGPWRWSALNMGFVNKRPSRMQGQWSLWNRTGRQQFSVWFRKFEFSGRAAASARIYLPRKVRGGSLPSPLIPCVFLVPSEYNLWPILHQSPRSIPTDTFHKQKHQAFWTSWNVITYRNLCNFGRKSKHRNEASIPRMLTKFWRGCGIYTVWIMTVLTTLVYFETNSSQEIHMNLTSWSK